MPRAQDAQERPVNPVRVLFNRVTQIYDSTNKSSRTNIGHIRLKMSGTYYLQDVSKGREQERKLFPVTVSQL